jgi:hypothetical protein
MFDIDIDICSLNPERSTQGRVKAMNTWGAIYKKQKTQFFPQSFCRLMGLNLYIINKETPLFDCTHGPIVSV